MQHVNALAPMAHVESVSQSVDFYKRLGFVVKNTFEPPERSEPVWAWLMLALADEPVVPAQQAVLFYVCCEDVAACRATFEMNGVKVGDIQFLFCAPRGEFRITDPDGFAVLVAHT